MADKNEAMENLFKAIDIITAERLSNLGYDRTIKATIIDDSKAEHGQYTLTDGSSTFDAYAADVLYKKDMTVYVIIPEGDYNNQKLIVGKCSNQGDAYYNYANPSDDFLDVTHNLITDTSSAEMIANYNEHQYIKLWSCDKVDYKGYNRLALKANFRTWLSPLEVVSGAYGLVLYVVSKETSYSGNDFERTHKFDLLTSDMYGDPFNFETFYLQEKVFDISDLTNIVSMELLLVQDLDFRNHEKELVPFKDEKGNLLDPNIYVQTPYVSLGYDLNDVKQDEVKFEAVNPKQENTPVTHSILSSITPQFKYIFENYSPNEELISLLPNSKFVKINEHEDEYSIGAIYEQEEIKLICYAVKCNYNEQPPSELGEHYQWLPIDKEDPLSEGYYIVFQDANDLKILKI
jgi:hypothetical protein